MVWAVCFRIWNGGLIYVCIHRVYMARLYWKIKDETGKWRWWKQLLPYPINPTVIEHCYCRVCTAGIVDEYVEEEE